MDAIDRLFSGYIVVVFVVIILVAAVGTCTSTSATDICRPSTPTHHVHCWSGGTMVVDEDYYKAGGYRCSPDGRELEWSAGDGVCLEEELP